MWSKLCTSAAFGGTCAAATFYLSSSRHQPARSQSAARDAIARRQAIIVGGGVVGISTAYQLSKRGFDVSVIEAAPLLTAADGSASAVSAGGMQRVNVIMGPKEWAKTVQMFIKSGITDRLAAAPTQIRHYFAGAQGREETARKEKEAFEKALVDPAANLKRLQEPFNFFRLRSRALWDPHFYWWLTQFTATSFLPLERLKTRQKDMLSFTEWAIDLTSHAIHKEHLNVGHASTGAAFVIYTPDELEKARQEVAAHPQGFAKASKEPRTVMELNKVASREPCLRQMVFEPAGALVETESRMGDSRRFTQQLGQVCVEKMGRDASHAGGKVTVKTDTRVMGFVTSGSVWNGNLEVKTIKTNEGDIDVDEHTPVVIAAGGWTARLFAKLGLYAPVYPMKGYSLIIDLPPKESPARPPESALPQGIVISPDKVLYFSRLGDQLRIASMGEFAGWNSRPDRQVVHALKERAVLFFPKLRKLVDEAHCRTGFRPFVSDGVILTGHVPSTRNVYVNVGPGFNGWKTCIGAGELIAREADRRTGGGKPEGEGQGKEEPALSFDPASFSPVGRVVPSFCLAPIASYLWSFDKKDTLM
ncbi:unnamed protein product [Vitrella brassicaformis CCMP3155]|uniref:FAD-dependent oxidoreductase domain-containing protein 1 n=1 Tax=Vitrella brassicaformis (strain CCMP3155) TaxID=1169540 RepID=A0A0G4H2M6_VITBC|nr:unnamed protein product [Vitrella brassicaformis CCMP3155]|mmetsp:Transcript_38362/g.96101  ORF Transcript_38362/g.96101 Transcript_38362/m.96101 type:complete len:589 (-) Transcript_38362:298-2064(-)|eukprot:CEM37749.1 unnamed protein product [Vitrella brassicaformis CCMP3155]